MRELRHGRGDARALTRPCHHAGVPYAQHDDVSLYYELHGPAGAEPLMRTFPGGHLFMLFRQRQEFVDAVCTGSGS